MEDSLTQRRSRVAAGGGRGVHSDQQRGDTDLRGLGLPDQRLRNLLLLLLQGEASRKAKQPPKALSFRYAAVPP